MNWRLPALLALVVAIAIAVAAPAVIIDSGDGTGNTTAPSPDPGWGNVGICNGLTCVYLGTVSGGWVLTANHVGAGDALFGGVVYPWVHGSEVRLSNPDTSPADLLLFEIHPPYPPVANLTIASATPPWGTPLVMAGNGHDRGAATSWMGIGGWLWGPSATLRWGTNFSEDVNHTQFEPGFGTKLFGSVFDQSGSAHEAQASVGDSGGPAFAQNGSSYALAGILLGIATYQNQPAQTALYGDYTFAADLSVYRNQIVQTMPEPAGGLRPGIALLAALSSAGTRRACRGTGCAASSPPRG
jgi:hypothetical protein